MTLEEIVKAAEAKENREAYSSMTDEAFQDYFNIEYRVASYVISGIYDFAFDDCEAEREAQLDCMIEEIKTEYSEEVSDKVYYQLSKDKLEKEYKEAAEKYK